MHAVAIPRVKPGSIDAHMQTKVPKFIDVQDKIIDGLTLWQVVNLAAAGVIAAIFFVVLRGPLGLVGAFLSVVSGVCFAFIKINERPFSVFLFSAMRFVINPKQFVWQKEAQKIKVREHKTAIPTRTSRQGGELTQQKIKELAMLLDVDEHPRQ